MMLLDDLLTVLDEQYRLVEAAGDDPDRLFARAWNYISRLRRDPRINAVLKTLISEAKAAEDTLRAAYIRHLEVARDILEALRADFPVLFEEPEPGPDEDVRREVHHGQIDRLLGRARNPVEYFLPEDFRSYRAIRIVQTYLERAQELSGGLQHDSPRWAELETLRRSEQLAQRFWRLRNLEPAFAYKQLSELLLPLDPDWTRTANVLEEYVLPMRGVVGWADGEPRNGRESREALQSAVATVQISVALVRAEVRARLGDTRSKLELFRRFKTRCEMYDRERLMALAAEAKGGAENRLSEELALFLFDQGLNPLIRARIGNVEPDVLDPEDHVYVEAKQYSDDAREAIRTGARQAWEMMARLSSTRYRVREAFLPVFRRGGPRYELPLEPIRNEQEFVLFAMLIDLAPAEEGGRMSQRKPISIATDELMPDQAGAEPAAQPLADRQRRPLVRRNARGK